MFSVTKQHNKKTLLDYFEINSSIFENWTISKLIEQKKKKWRPNFKLGYFVKIADEKKLHSDKL